MAIGDTRATFILTTPDNAYTLANEIKADYNIHIASAIYHVAADTSNAVSSTDATTLATLYTLANEIKADYNAHIISTSYHRVAGSDLITSHDASSAVTAYELLEEIKAKYNKHIASVTYHLVADTSNPSAALSSKLGALNEDFNADGGSVLIQLTGAGSWDGTVDFQTTVDGATFYNIPYISRSTITPTPTVAQISSPSTAAVYMLLGPLSQVRIACATGTVGSLTVSYRTIQPDELVVAYLVAGANLIGKVGIDQTTPGTTNAVAETTGAYTTPAHTAVDALATTTVALAANANRLYAAFINDSDEVIYLGLGTAAVLNIGVRLNASGGSYEMSKKLGNLYVGAVNCISTSGTKILAVTEGV